MVLEVRNLHLSFFGIKALDDVSLDIKEGKIVGLIGPNGAGKTTLFNCVTGFLKPDQGKIFFKNKDITECSSYEIALRGISITFQLVKNFGDLTVLENMIIAIQEHQERSLFLRFIRARFVRENEKKAIERAKFLLKFMGLDHLAKEKASNLSYGQQKILSVAQALMPEPDILLLDEPTAAVNPALIKEIQSYLTELNEKRGQTIFLIEHNMDVAMSLCKRIIVMSSGRIIAEGTPEEIQNNEEVKDAYFGD